MHEVVGIRFRNCGRIYDFELNGFEVVVGDSVVVESEFGLSIGTIVIGRHSVEKTERELKKVLHKATEEDIKKKEDNEAFSREARDFCLERIMARGIPMQLIYTEVTLDRKRVVFYFTADGRIDFRELVKDLAAQFRTRIEMRQIGVRDKAKFVGGAGICGKELCCRQFLTSFEPISIRMAKQQELVLNTNKLSGVCGRLMCCLGFECGEIGQDGADNSDDTSVPVTDEQEVLESVAVKPGERSSELLPGGDRMGEQDSLRPEQKPGQKEPTQPRKARRRRRRRKRHRGKFQKT
jgi:cell fate regulator YaaT (PSP1 superfamily)